VEDIWHSKQRCMMGASSLLGLAEVFHKYHPFPFRSDLNPRVVETVE
jgi:hypothetical protein